MVELGWWDWLFAATPLEVATLLLRVLFRKTRSEKVVERDFATLAWSIGFLIEIALCLNLAWETSSMASSSSFSFVALELKLASTSLERIFALALRAVLNFSLCIEGFFRVTSKLWRKEPRFYRSEITDRVSNSTSPCFLFGLRDHLSLWLS